MHLRKPLRGLALAAALLAAAAPPATAQSPGLRSRAPVTLNFVNADVDAVSRAMAAMVQQQIIVDPRVKGTITLYSEQPISVREAYQSYQAALRGLGFALVESAGLLKVVPEADAKLQAGTVQVGPPAARGDQVLTQIFKLSHENPNNLVAVLRPLISPNNTINANPGSNALVITDYADNLQRIAKIIAALDQPSATDVEVVPLQHAVAADLVQMVQRLADGGGAAAVVPGAAAGGGVSVLADTRSNALIVRAASPARLAAVRALIEKLDRPSAGGPAGSIWVVHLKNADAAKLATVLRAAFAGAGSGASGGGGGATAAVTAAPNPNAPGGAQATPATTPVSASAQPSTGGFIQADPSTNSLIITAPEPLYKQIRAMIEQLDTRRAQVYIESMIVEVAPSVSADFGFQWQGLLGIDNSKWGLAAGTNFGTAGNNIAALSVAPPGSVAPGAGLNVALIKDYGSAYGLAAIMRALQSQTDVNVVSTPNLVTLDNEEAKIVVGENVPFITGQYTSTGTTTSNPFQTIERKDVGITLRIKPQVGEGQSVRMTIYQEQSSVKPDVAAGTDNAGPSTTKRSIESTVTVDDGAILVLGGLIEDRVNVTKNKVPLLGDIPYVGGLFRSESRERKRSNLLVFLRPIVMRTAEDANKLSLDRYEYMRGQQKEAQPTPSAVLPINEAPVLPPLRAPLLEPPAQR